MTERLPPWPGLGCLCCQVSWGLESSIPSALWWTLALALLAVSAWEVGSNSMDKQNHPSPRFSKPWLSMSSLPWGDQVAPSVARCGMNQPVCWHTRKYFLKNRFYSLGQFLAHNIDQRFRDFPHSPCPHACTASPIGNIA